MVQEMFRRSPSPEGFLHFGITVTNSCFQMTGQIFDAVIYNE